MLTYGNLEDACGKLIEALTRELAKYHRLELEGFDLSSLIKKTQENLDDVLGLLQRQEGDDGERADG